MYIEGHGSLSIQSLESDHKFQQHLISKIGLLKGKKTIKRGSRNHGAGIAHIMKASRLPAITQEECGVWLDTAELRRKRKAVQLPGRISRLLNPLAPSAGYCIPAAVSFTQTTLQFPATKQSSITNFLSPRCHEKKGAEPAAVIDPPSSAPQRKRKRFDEPEEPFDQSARGVVPGLRVLPVADLGGRATEGSRRVGTYEDEEREEPPKRPLRDLRETQAQSLELLFTQDSEGRRVIAHPAAAYRSPLKDRTNSSAGAERPWSVSSRPLVWEESDSVFEHCSDLLFTQDSEGNRVMKH
ncbi:hypothetical protein GJAV_G00106920 [Gymnothorax javanicus]|nr:hypothetical protein GJAV_G00106920 [Gymnothorax javanicus]